MKYLLTALLFLASAAPVSAATFRLSPATSNLPVSSTNQIVSAFLNTQNQAINSYQVIINYSYTGTQDIPTNSTTLSTTSSDFNFCQNAITHNASSKTGRIVVGCLTAFDSSFTTGNLERQMFTFPVPTNGIFTFTFDTSPTGSKVEPSTAGTLNIVQNPVTYTFTTQNTPTPTPALPTNTPILPTSTPRPTATPTVAPTQLGSLTIELKIKGLPSSKSKPSALTADIKIGLSNSTQDLYNFSNSSFTKSQSGYSFTTPVIIQPNTYRITIQKPNYLDRIVSPFTIAAGPNTLSTTLVPGDFDCSNRLDIADISAQLSSFTSLSTPISAQTSKYDIDNDGFVSLDDIAPVLSSYTQLTVAGDGGTKTGCNSPPATPTSASPTSTIPPQSPTPRPPTPTSVVSSGESMAMMAWQVGSKNAPNPTHDKCEDGTDVSLAHKQYYVIAYDGLKYPTWHPPVVTNPVTGVGKCYFGHEHGTNPQTYNYWNEIVQHFGKDINGDSLITKMTINPTTGAITPGDRAGIPFGIANEHMDQYYNQEGRDSIFVRHEDHVGHKIEAVNQESDLVGNTTHPMTQVGAEGINIPYYKNGNSNVYYPTGVTCTHLHKFHQGSSSADAIRNNLHEVIFHSKCNSYNISGINAPAYYPNNTVLLTGMMAFGKPGEYVRFCFSNRYTKVCPDGKNPDGSCVINDPLISKLPDAINSNSLGRNMVDRYCLENWNTLNPGNNYFAPYELWEGDLAITTPTGKMIAEHGRQWDILDPIRFVDPKSPTGFSFNSENCKKPGGAYDKLTYVGGCADRNQNIPWDSTQSGFKGLKRTTYFGRNRVSNNNGNQIYWTDPMGGNAVTSQFTSGLKQKISAVEANICNLPGSIGGCTYLNDRAIQRTFNSGGNTVHAPN